MKHFQCAIFARILFLIALLPLTVFSQIRVYHYTWPGNNVDSLNAGVISASGIREYDVWIYNPTNDTLSYWNSSGSGGQSLLLNFASSGGLIVFPHDSGLMTAIIDPRGGINYDGTMESIGNISIYFASAPYQHVADIQLFFEARVDLIADGSFPLFQNQWMYHGLYTHDSNQNSIPLDSVQYINDQDSIVTIQTMFVPKGSHFTITSSHNFPISLKKNEKLTVHYSYSQIADSIGYIIQDPIDTTKLDTIYNDLVVIITDTTYPVAKANYQGFPPKVNQKSIVENKNETVQTFLSVSQNPLYEFSDIAVTNMTFSVFHIFDLLGNEVADHSGSSWRWNGSSSSGIRLPDGVYLIEADGISTDGKPIHATQNIILMK